jgi:beta-glucanase (GH16 family)
MTTKIRFQMRMILWIVLSASLLISSRLQAQVGEVIWQEDFNTLNTSIWNVDVGDGTGTPAGAGWGNQELEYYNTPNVFISDVPGEQGNKALVLKAHAEAMGTRAFTSGKVTTSGKLSIKYGLVEMRIRVPNLATGLWPAAWLLGTSNIGWPGKGEIDMMEMGHNLAERTRQGFPSSSVNNFAGSNLIFYSADAVSSGNPSGAASTAWDVNYDQPYVASTSLNDRFLIYRMYWSSTSIRFTVVDGANEIDLYTSPFTITSVSDEFQNPFYFILNLAVGGQFTDAASNGQVTAPLPAQMYIDYIKVSKWNNQGEVSIGGPVAETGTFGVFTDNTATTHKLVAGSSSDIYAWNNFVAGTTPAYEGSNVIAWATSSANTWFGGGILARQPTNMSNFVNGNLKFRIKIPANISFKIGMTDNYTNEKYITFPANETKYGLTRDGNWGQVTIPISDFAGLLAFQSMNYMFTIVSVDGQLPTTTFQLGIDDIYWEGGGGTTPVLTSLVVTPASSSITAGSTQQFTAKGLDQSGNPFTISPTWTAMGGTISTTGLFTGTTAGGPYTITAKSGAVSGSASITVTSGGCAITASTGDYSTVVSNDASNPSLTFVPITAGSGSSTCILYYSTNPSVTFPGYGVTPNVPYQITATAGATVYFYYTYSLAAGGENNTLNSKKSFTVGNCSTLKAEGSVTVVADASDEAIQAYPIPMGNNLFIKLNTTTYNRLFIADAMGKILIKKNISGLTGLLNIDVSNLAKGIYYIKLENSTTSVKKLIVK